jgi:hypothetical protein
MVKPNVMARIQRKVLKLGKQKALEKRKVGRGVAKEAKVLTKAAKAKAKEEKAKAKPKAKAKKLSKTEFIDKLDDDSMKKGVMGLPFSYHDAIVSYRNDYPRIAKTEKQMDKLSEYTYKQVNKQLYDHYKSKGDLKSFNVRNVYGKAF